MQVINPLRMQGPYFNRMKGLFGASIIAYWPLWETAGGSVYDQSGHGYTAAYSGPTLGQVGIGDGRKCPLFDGVNDSVNAYSAGFAGAFNGAEGSALFWFKMANAGVWTDGIDRRLFNFKVDNNNYLSVYKKNTDNLIYYERLAQGGTWKGNSTNVYGTSTSWNHAALTWSESAAKFKSFANGTHIGTDIATNGVWTGLLAATLTQIGCSGVASYTSGYLAHFVFLNRPATSAEILLASKV